MCRALTNLLDNAIHASSKFEDTSLRKIELNAYVDANYLFIRVWNTKNNLETKRKEKSSGRGLIILNDLAEKYKGKFYIENEEDTFTALLTMKI